MLVVRLIAAALFLISLPMRVSGADFAARPVIDQSIASKTASGSEDAPGGSPQEKKPPLEADGDAAAASLDALARFLAGMRIPDTVCYYDGTKKSAWKKYAAAADGLWSSFNKNRAAAMRAWSSSALADAGTRARTVLYPFSGPDFLHAYTFFPAAETYILIGLEPTGRLPAFSAYGPEDFSACFQLLERFLRDVLQISFFRTNDMSEELSGKCISGTLPVIMLFLARTGCTVTALRFFDLDGVGSPVFRASAAECRGKKGFCRGLEIEFTAGGAGAKKRLVYLSADLSDNGFSRCPSCRAYLQRIEGPVLTFVKSASYLMHKSYFSGVRELLLDKSAFILQDDSGIPYRYYKDDVWQVTLYGSYKGPIAMFKDHFEKDLAEAYRQGAQKIGFRYGYARRSSLLLARKK